MWSILSQTDRQKADWQVYNQKHAVLYHLYFTFKLSIYILNFSVEFFPLAIAVQNTQPHLSHPQTTHTQVPSTTPVSWYLSSLRGGLLI